MSWKGYSRQELEEIRLDTSNDEFAKEIDTILKTLDDIVLPEDQLRSIEKTKTNLAVLVDILEYLNEQLVYSAVPNEWHRDIVLLWLEKQLEA